MLGTGARACPSPEQAVEAAAPSARTTELCRGLGVAALVVSQHRASDVTTDVVVFIWGRVVPVMKGPCPLCESPKLQVKVSASPSVVQARAPAP